MMVAAKMYQMKQRFQYTDENTKEVIQIASQLLNKYTYRITGTDVALKAGEAIKEMFSISCQKSTLEPFRVFPGQLWNIGKILTSIYLISVIGYWLGIIGIYISICIILIGLVYGISHFILYSSVFDKLFIGMPMDFKNKIAYYHTPFDTIDKIEPKAVKSVIDLAVNYILDLDSTT